MGQMVMFKKKTVFFSPFSVTWLFTSFYQRASENCELKRQSLVHIRRKRSAECLGEGSVDLHHMLQVERVASNLQLLV